jgi:hypothetical protein
MREAVLAYWSASTFQRPTHLAFQPSHFYNLRASAMACLWECRLHLMLRVDRSAALEGGSSAGGAQKRAGLKPGATETK